MKKTIIALGIAGLLGFGLLGSPAEAGAAAKGTITVTGSGSMTLKRDQATTNLSVTAAAGKAADAMAQATAIYNAVRKAVLDVGIKADNLTTSGISLYPEWDYTTTSTGGTKPVLRDYRATLSVQVMSTVPNAAKVLDVATSTGGDAVSINGISFDVADPESITDTSRVRAITNARTKARDYAEALGQHVGRALKIVETGAAVPSPIWAGVAKDQAAGAVVEVDPGTQRVTSSVTVTFQLLG